MTDYKFDIFFSYKRDRLLKGWVKEVHDTLILWVSQELQRKASVFIDVECIEDGEQWPDALREALRTSKCMFEKPTIAAYVALLSETGLRKQEGLNLRWDHINFAQRIVSVEDTKSGKPRYVPLSTMQWSSFGRSFALSGVRKFSPDSTLATDG